MIHEAAFVSIYCILWSYVVYCVLRGYPATLYKLLDFLLSFINKAFIIFLTP